MWPFTYLDIQLGPVGQEIYSIELSIEDATTNNASSLTPDMNWVVSFLQSPQITNSHVHQVSELDCKSSPHLTSTVKDHWTALPKVWELIITAQFFWSMGVKIQISLYISPSSGLFFISPDEDLLFEVETSRVNFLVSFNSDDQRNTDVRNHSRRHNIQNCLDPKDIFTCICDPIKENWYMPINYNNVCYYGNCVHDPVNKL